jgi:hypothetical protein
MDKNDLVRVKHMLDAALTITAFIQNKKKIDLNNVLSYFPLY